MVLTSDLPQIAQAEALLSWLSTIPTADLERLSCLPGWTVRELVVHLGMSLGSALTVRPADVDPDVVDPADVMTAADYLALAPDLADRIAAGAIEKARQIDDPVDFLRQQQWSSTERMNQWGGRDRLLQVRGRLLPLSAYLDARLVETVVHTMDLAVSLPDVRPPHLFRNALDRVVLVLREALTARAPDPVAAVAAASRMPAPEFIAMASGRHEGEPDPDLAAALPLL